MKLLGQQSGRIEPAVLGRQLDAAAADSSGSAVAAPQLAPEPSDAAAPALSVHQHDAAEAS